MFPQKNTANSPLAIATDPDAINILIADNQVLIREALRPALHRIDDRISLFECGDLRDVIQLANQKGPLALAILALNMPGMNGVEGVRHFRERFPEIPLAVLSGSHGINDIVRSFDHGAIGFLSTVNTADSITSAVGLMLSGQRYVPGEIMDAMQRRAVVSPGSEREGDTPEALLRLTERERQVLALLIEGKPNKAIAIALGVREVTVKLHIRKLLRKLGVSNRTQAVTFALQAGWRPDS